MSRYFIHVVVFLAGLAAVCWIGAGYLGSNPLALLVTLLIGACYAAGAFELRRYQQATSTLAGAVAGLSGPPPSLGAWLEPLDGSLRNAVRLRVEGERVALPGPALTPYLVGLLVLLGMLGTLLGMVATLRGTGIALDSATDLQAIRTSLAAPVRGLGFAFGTSIAGVATSAMLGLLSALCRRERLDAAQRLDVKIATHLRVYSRAHQRDETFALLRRQADVMPALVDRLQAMMTSLEQQHHALNERQLASQHLFHDKAEAAYTRFEQLSLALSERQLASERLFHDKAEAAHVRFEQQSQALGERQLASQALFHGKAEAAYVRFEQQNHALGERQLASQTLFHDKTEALYTGLAASVEQTLKESVADSARTVSATLQPVVEATMAGLARETAGLHGAVTQAVQRQLDGLTSGFDATAATVAELCKQALTAHRHASDALTGHLRASLDRCADTFEQRAAGLVEGVAARLEGATGRVSDAWNDVLSRQEAVNEKLAARNQHALTEAAASFGQHSAALLRDVSQSHAQGQAEAASRDQQRLAAWTDTLGAMAATLREEWAQASACAASSQQEICDVLARTAHDISAQTQAHADASEALAARSLQGLTQASASFEQHSAALLRSVGQSQADGLAEAASRDQQRLAAWTDTLGAMAAALREEWAQASAQAASRQQEVCDTLARTARDISAQTQAHAGETIAEIARLVAAASEAPRAAAEIVAELRQKLSDSMVRDTAMLEERSRLLATLETLLDAVNHASTEQRAAVDALVGTSADLLDRVATRFTDHIEAETGRLGAVAAQVTGSAVEVASLGDAFGAAVQVFGESNDKLVAHLQRIEAALDKSLARSDEQLAYYVAQAREVVDLSVLSQKQIVDDLQQLAGRRASAGAEAA
ncbi:DUF802 domain-containing protein [Burkholderia alba]|uniref:DUF802 domain-containing protein n=1 Tax=Burkholderia alba TaxID=2683677 RepID=UPI002B06252C|nr:DUF802 domain-containing protein [Burkholderia alba]